MPAMQAPIVQLNELARAASRELKFIADDMSDMGARLDAEIEQAIESGNEPQAEFLVESNTVQFPDKYGGPPWGKYPFEMSSGEVASFTHNVNRALDAISFKSGESGSDVRKRLAGRNALPTLEAATLAGNAAQINNLISVLDDEVLTYRVLGIKWWVIALGLAAGVTAFGAITYSRRRS